MSDCHYILNAVKQCIYENEVYRITHKMMYVIARDRRCFGTDRAKFHGFSDFTNNRCS